MKNTRISGISKEKKNVSTFGGYNHNFRINENEFFDMKNMSSRHYPLLSCRKPRGNTSLPCGAEAMEVCSVHNADRGNTVPIYNDVFAVVYKDEEGNRLSVTDGETVFRIDDITSNGETQLIVQSGKLFMFPQKTKLDLLVNGNGSNVTSLENETAATVSGIDAQVRFYPCNSKGQSDDICNYIGVIVTDLAGGEKVVLERNGTIQKTTESGASFGIDIGFKAGDGISISGAGDLDGFYTVYAVDNTETGRTGEVGTGLILNGVISEEIKISNGTVSFSRKVPDLDFVVEANNRLFGCRYGVNEKNEVINEIYISALGDPTNWYKYQGISTDSETITVGEDGPFTGAVVYDDTPIFFKENCIIRVYGDYPPYTVKSYKYRGVQKGSAKSICICDEILYYQSYDGILAYNGAAPVKVDSALGEIHYKNGVAGSLGKRYYISMEDNNGAHNLFVYDSEYGMWHREDSIGIKQFCRRNNELFFIDSTGNVMNTEGSDEKSIEWYAESGVIGFGDINEKFVCAIQARIYLPVGSLMTFEIEYDEDGVWHHLDTVNGHGTHPFVYKMRPRRCDRYKLKISGKGEGRVISITHTLEGGSDTAVRGGSL